MQGPFCARNVQCSEEFHEKVAASLKPSAQKQSHPLANTKRSRYLCCPFMLFCIAKHKKDQTIPNPTRHPAPGASHGQLPPWLLQCSPTWSPSLCYETSADGPEPDGASGLRSAENSTRHPSVHWTPLAIKFKSLMLAYKVLNGTAPIYLNALAKAYVTTRSLHLSKDCRLAVPTPR